MRYWEESAGGDLGDAVARISFSSDGGRPSPPVRVLPDGSSDLLVSIDPASRRVRLRVFGVKTTALCVESPRPIDQLGVHLRPEAAACVLGIPAFELRDRVVELDALWGESARKLAERLAEAADFDTLRRRLMLALADQIAVRRTRIPPRIRAAVARIQDSAGRLDVAAMARELETSPRTLERSFRRHVGMGPKLLCRTVRFQNARAALAAGRRAADVALECGYADQPHMVREFRALAGVTPRSL